MSERDSSSRVLWRGPASVVVAAAGGAVNDARETLVEPARSSAEARAMFEARARELLRAPLENVLAVLGVAGDGAVLVRWPAGEPLDVAAQRTVPPRVAAAIVHDIALAIAALHERGMIHGSLGAHSAIIEPSGRVTLVDAASAPVAAALSGLVSAVRSHVAPDAERGPAGDVWSLGSLLHQLLLGDPPGDTVLAPAERRTGIPESLDFAVMHALRRAPSERPSARAFAELIEEALEGRDDAPAEVAAWLARPHEVAGETPHAAALPEGALIAGTYHIDGTLGRGGMGIVHAATHVGMRRPVAIKVLLAQPTRAPRLVQRFVREARIVGALDHPSIVRIYDLGHDGRPYLVMERLEGETLRARLERGPLSVSETLSIASRVAGALAHAHLRGVVHRDVKPENVFLARRSDGSERVVLLDFGISKLETDEAITMTGAVIGTPRYLAPEQARGSRDVGPATDVYLAGVLIHEMLSGRTPIDANDPIALLIAISEGRRQRLRAACPTAPRWLERLVDRATATEPRDRFADAAELARAMSQHVELDEVTARELKLPPRPRRGRTTAIVAATLATAAVIALGLGVAHTRETQSVPVAPRTIVVRVPVPVTSEPATTVATPPPETAATVTDTPRPDAPRVEPRTETGRVVRREVVRARPEPSEPPAETTTPFVPRARAGALSADDL